MARRLSAEELVERLSAMTPEERQEFHSRLSPSVSERVGELLKEHETKQHQQGNRVTLLEHQKLPPPQEIDSGHLFAGGRGAGKTMALSYYLARLAERVPMLRMRVISPTTSDAVNGVGIDPYSGILAQSPSAVFKSHGVEGTRIVWPNGAVCYLLGTPTLKDVDRLRALTNIDVDAYDEAAANPRITEAVQQANLSRRGRALHHPIWIAATTPRPVPQYKKWLKDPRVSITHARTIDNPHTPDSYREYAASLKGTALYRQEILGEVLDDTPGALWKHADVNRSLIEDDTARAAVMAAITRTVVGVDPPTGHGTCGIVVVGMTDPDLDPAGFARIVILDDYSISEATPGQWGQQVIDAHRAYGATIVAERNQGGLMVESTISNAARSSGIGVVPVTLATATLSKEMRAGPMALLWEMDEQRAAICTPDGSMSRLALLIEQMTSWIPGTYSPDHLDAAAWASAYLIASVGGGQGAVLQTPAAMLRRNARNPSTGFRAALMGASRYSR